MWWYPRNWTEEILNEALARTKLMDAETFLRRAENDQHQARLIDRRKKLRNAKEHDEKQAQRVIPNAIAYGVTVMLKQKAMADSIVIYANSIGLDANAVMASFTTLAGTTLQRMRKEPETLDRVWTDAFVQVMYGDFTKADSYPLSNPTVPSVHQVQDYYMMTAELCLIDEALISSYRDVASQYGYDYMKASKVYETSMRTMTNSQPILDACNNELAKLYAYQKNEPFPDPPYKRTIQSKYDFEMSMVREG